MIKISSEKGGVFSSLRINSNVLSNANIKVKRAVVATLALATIGASVGFTGAASAVTASNATSKDLVYCNGQKLDYYAPRKVKYAKTPVIVYIHGGGLIGGDKRAEMTQLNYVDQMLDQGYAIVSINYRLLNQSPNQNTTAPIEDTLCAIRYIRASAVNNKFDPNRIAVYGWSSGAALAAQAGALPANSPLNKGDFLGYSGKPNAVIALAGNYDLPYAEANPTTFNQQAIILLVSPYYNGMKVADIQPYNQLSADDPAMFFLNGTKDTSVDPIQTDRMMAKAVEVGAKTQAIRVTNGGHGLDAVGGPISPTLTSIKASLTTFLNNTLKP